MERAYSLLTIKSVDEEKRVIEGIATTPSTDRMGDIVEPKGAEFTLPIPLLWQHDSKQPIGQVTAAKVTDKGIAITAKIAKDLLPRIDEAWALIKSGLVRGLSIGFQPLESARIEGTFGYRYLSWSWLELSAVTVAANADASIQTIKSVDTAQRAALGARGVTPRPGATGQSPKGTSMKTIKEMQERRDQVAARMKELDTGCGGDFSVLAAEELTEFDSLRGELKQLDVDLDRRQSIEAAAKGATPVSGASPEDASKSRRSVRVEAGKDNLPKGLRFARSVIAMAAGRNSRADAIDIARSWYRDTPEVAEYIRSGAPGTGASGNWAENITVQNVVVGEFLDLLRPATILGRVNGFRTANFNTKMIVQTAGSTVDWVGNGLNKPTGNLDFDFVTIDFAKCAGIVVLTDDQIAQSNINSEQAVTQDLVRQVAQFLDVAFIDPSKSVSAGLNPASVTNTSTPVSATGTDADKLRLNLKTAFAKFTTAGYGLGGITMITTADLAMGIALLTNSFGVAEFPGMTINGGTLLGMPVIVSDNVPSGVLALVKAGEIFVADNGGVRVDASREATIDLGTAGTMSMFQANAVALRAERMITWVKTRDDAVQYIASGAYGPT